MVRQGPSIGYALEFHQKDYFIPKKLEPKDNPRSLAKYKYIVQFIQNIWLDQDWGSALARLH